MKKRFLQMVKKRVLSLRLFPLLVCLGFLIPVVGWGQAGTPEGVWTDYAADGFAGGSGTESDPYQIATAGQLAKLSKAVSAGTSYQGNYFILTADIDLSAHRWSPIGIYKWEKNGSTTNKSFQGFLDGNDKTISGMYVDETDDKNSAGLFGYINIRKNGAEVDVKDLTIADAVVIADENGLTECSAGLLAGRVMGADPQSIVFENITVSGSVTVTRTNGMNNIGGMLGYASWVKATNCHAKDVSISGGSNSGGFVGNDSGSAYENCTASGTIDGAWALGGFVGYSTSAVYQSADGASTYTKCTADVDVSGNDWRVGGFVGYARYGEFYNCVAYGDVDSNVNGGDPKVGGFVGESGGDLNDPDNDNGYANATNCHAAGTVTSASPTHHAGGFTGTHSKGTFSGCSFDSEKNPGLNAAGKGTLASGVTGEETAVVLANICEDYYGSHLYSTEWTVDIEATCTTSGSKSHHCERCGAKGSITEIPVLGHKWGEPVYTWSDDYAACTATRTCKNDASHTESATATVTSEQTQSPTCTEMGEMTYTATFTEEWAEEQTKIEDIPATGHHYVNGYCTECGHRDPNYVDPISYYNIYEEEVCDGVEITTSKNVVREGGSINVYVEKDTANYTFDNFKVYYKRSYYGGWEELKEGTQPGEYPINNIWTHIYIKAEGAEEKEDPTGLEDIEGVKVYTKDGSLYVQTPQREQVIIISMAGAVVKNEEQVGLKQYHGLQPGIYIVRVGDRTYKVRLY